MSSRRAVFSAAPIPPRGLLRGAIDRIRLLSLTTRGALGRLLSVRWKLTLWYGLMTALTLALLGYGMRWALEYQINANIDQKLQDTGQSIRLVLHANLPPGLNAAQSYQAYTNAIQAQLAQNSYSVTQPGQFEQVELQPIDLSRGSCLILAQRASGADPCVLGSGDTQGIDLSGNMPLFFDALRNGSALGSVTHGNQTLRAYFIRLQTPPALQKAGVGGLLEVFETPAAYQQVEQTFTVILLVGIPLALLIALVIGWWITRAALRPIDRISRTVQAIGVSRDLSRRVAFVGPMDEVGRLANTFDDMMGRLEKVFDTQKRFVADASHELRTPLTAIRGNADLYRIAPPQERDDCITAIRRESERMSRLVADLLLLAAADIEEQPVHKQEIDLGSILRDVYRSAGVLAGEKVKLTIDVKHDVTLQADPDRIKQLVLNLVDNAIKFTPEGGDVTVRLVREGQLARIDVIDSGIGIPQEEQQSIFDRFYRVETSRSKRGSGLGLSICSWIAAAHNGRIGVSSRPGGGSTFSVWLPLGLTGQGALTSQDATDQAV